MAQVIKLQKCVTIITLIQICNIMRARGFE